MSFLGKIWDKVQNYLIVSAFVYGGIMTTLYYHSSHDLKQAEIKLQEATTALTECTEGKDKLEESKEGDDSITLDQITKLKDLEKKNQSLLDRLANIPKKPDCEKATSQVEGVNESINEEINIDSPLPSELTSLLNEAYHSDKGSGGVTTRSPVD